jgi:ER lumen protein retaining receptor
MMSSKISAKSFGIDANMLTAYLAAAAIGLLVIQSFEGLGLSTLITLGVGIQCFGYICLRLKIAQQKSVAGISGRSLILQALSICFRLSSTTWLKGYIPVDGTGDWLYQCLDVITLLMILQILHCIFKTHRPSYQEEHDNFNVQVVALSCFVVASLVHPDLNNRPVFDTLWTTALYIDVVSMLPQLSMMSNLGKTESLTCHYVGAIAISRVISLMFWYYGYVEVAPLDGSFNLAGWGILVAHLVQVLLFCDFLFYYIRACVRTGCHPRLDLASGMIDV